MRILHKRDDELQYPQFGIVKPRQILYIDDPEILQYLLGTGNFEELVIKHKPIVADLIDNQSSTKRGRSRRPE